MAIIPYLERGDVVCTDRFRESMVYGSEKNNAIDLHMLVELNLRLHGQYWVWPDRVFVFDLPAELAIERGKVSGRQFDEMEKIDTLSRVRDNFQMFAKEYPEANLCFVDASRNIEEVFFDVRAELVKCATQKKFKLDPEALRLVSA